MLTWIREKFGTILIGGIIGFIAFVFVFYGVFNPKATRGMHEGAVAGTVNGDSITISEFNQALNRQLEFYKNIMGGTTITEEQMKRFNIRNTVFENLVRRRIQIQQAGKIGLLPSDAQLRQQIQEIPAFQKDGRFDRLAYRQAIQNSPYRTEGAFERLLREDLAAQAVEDFFRDSVQVSENEIQKQFVLSENKRNIKYIMLTSESGLKGMEVSDAEVTKFLSDPAKLNLAKSTFEGKKDREFKGKTFDDVKQRVARDLIAGGKVDEIKKLNESLADKVVALLTPAKTSDAKVNALLKPYGVEVRSTGMLTQLSAAIPGIGEAPELMNDAFASTSPIDPTQGGKAKKYTSGLWIVVAVVSESQKPDLAKLPKERARLARELTDRKSREILQTWYQKVRKEADVEPNVAVIGSENAG